MCAPNNNRGVTYQTDENYLTNLTEYFIRLDQIRLDQIRLDYHYATTRAQCVLVERDVNLLCQKNSLDFSMHLFYHHIDVRHSTGHVKHRRVQSRNCCQTQTTTTTINVKHIRFHGSGKLFYHQVHPLYQQQGNQSKINMLS